MRLNLKEIIVLTLLGICSTVHAQMKVESFEYLEQDQDARYSDTRLQDPTNKKKLCAIIKVVTTEMDCTFDNGSLGIAKVVKHPEMAEIWVYVPVETMKIKISHPRHGQLDTKGGYFEFPERCKSGTVYRLKLHTEFNPDEDIVKEKEKFAKVKFNVYPRNAKIILRSMPELTDENGWLEKTMALGIYHYRVSADNYHYTDGKFELTEEGTTKNININLRQAFGWAVLPAGFEPTGCRFSINGVPYTATGNRIAIPSGQHKLSIAKTHYYTDSINVIIRDSVETPISFDMRPILGKLMVNTPDLPGSTVKIDGKVVGMTPFAAAQDIIVGKHTIEVSRPNYVSQTQEVEIFEGKTETLNLSLTSMGNFVISSTPAGASLYINNRYIGVTPCSMTDLASGDYSVRLEKDKYRTVTKTEHLDAANPNNSFKLYRQYQRPWQVYIQPTFQAISYKSVGAAVGGYLYNVNIEGDFLYGLDKETIFIKRVEKYSSPDKKQEPVKIEEEEKMSSLYVGGKVGYGFIIGTRLRVTPQVGFGFTKMFGKAHTHCYSLSTSFGARVDFVVVKHLGVVVAPEYQLAVKQSETYKLISEVSPRMKKWGQGFNLRLGINVYF